MKIKYPKTITIGTRTFTVSHDKQPGAEFNWNNGTLRIGTAAGNNQLGVLNMITHEIFEMWAVSLYLRYDRPDTFNSYEFHFDHRHFTNLCELATKTLAEFIV